MSKLAEVLVAARQMKGVSLAEAARATRIKQSHLAALEADAFERLPPAVYTRGFVSNYAVYLDLDRAQIMRLYDEAIGYRPAPTHITPPPTVRTGGPMAPNIAAIGVALVVTGVLFTWLYSAFFVTNPNRATRVPTPFIPTPTPLTALVLTTPTPTPEPIATETPAPTLVPAAATAAAGGPPESFGRPFATATPPPVLSTLSLKVSIIGAPSWVQVRTDGVVVFSGTLAVGAERTFTAKDEIFIHAGRSDAVDLVFNGQRLGRLGQTGQPVVRRTFTREDGPTATPTAPVAARAPCLSAPCAA